MVIVYYTERLQYKISKGKRHKEKLGAVFQNVPSQWSCMGTRFILLTITCDNTCQVLPVRKFIQALMSRVIVESQSHRQAATPTFLTSPTHTPVPQSKSRCSSYHVHSINCLVQLVLHGPGPQAHRNIFIRQNNLGSSPRSW